MCQSADWFGGGCGIPWDGRIYGGRSPLTPMNTVTAADCFDSPAFCAWWDDVEDATDNHGWDDGDMLNMLVELYNEGCPVPDAAADALEAYEIGIAEYYMGIPSWA